MRENVNEPLVKQGDQPEWWERWGILTCWTIWMHSRGSPGQPLERQSTNEKVSAKRQQKAKVLTREQWLAG